MKTKICTKCKQEKSLEEFSPDKRTKDGKGSCCRICCNLIRKNQRKKRPWNRIYQNIKARCANPKASHFKNYGGRGIKCLITEEEVKKLWYRDKAYNLKKPSIDRKENNGNYEYSNCQFIELGKNSAKDKEKVINQYDLNGNFIKTWKSATDVQRTIGFNQRSISAVCLGKRKTANGFIWKGLNNV